MKNISTDPAMFETLKRLNDEAADVRLPAIIFQSVMIVVGVSGNFFVWLIYGYRIKKHSAHRYLVLGKAVYDTLACCFGIPGNIVDLMNPYMFYSSVGCKLLRFGYHVLGVGCSLSHFLNGIDRYRRICYPLSTQMSNAFVKRMLIFLFVLSLILVSPTLEFYDSVDTPTEMPEVTGRQCSQSEKWSSSLYVLVFEIILSVLVLVNVTCLVVFYTLIGRKLCKRESIVGSVATSSIHRKGVPAERRAKNDGVEMTKDECVPQRDRKDESFHETSVNTVGNIHRVNDRPSVDVSSDELVSELRRSHSENTQVKTFPKDTDGHNDTTDVLALVKQMQIRRTSLRNTKSRKFTLITFLLAMIFVLSYFPVMVLALLSNLDPDKPRELSLPLKRTYFVFLVTYTINNVSNPLVYLAIDEEFRHQIRQCFVSVFARLKMTNN